MHKQPCYNRGENTEGTGGQREGEEREEGERAVPEDHT